jgi:DNA repair protein RecN (Recombination protein N)
MLKRLRIDNLVLIKHVELFFQPGFTIITGETGSGKTILLQALKYVTGERSDADAVREGSDKALIEAEFALPKNPIFESLLDEGGISWERHDPLLLKREISREGRSRAFINCQMVTLSFLQKMGKYLIDFTDQHAHHTLKDPDQHRKLLDLFGCYPDLLEAAKKAKQDLFEIEDRFSSLQLEIAARGKRLEEMAFSIEEISNGNIQPNENQTITQEHHRLLHMQELMEKTTRLEQFLEQPPLSLIIQAKKIHQLLQQLCSIDPHFEGLLPLSHEISMNAQELGRSISSYRSKIEPDPKRLDYLEERIALIERLERKYGDPLKHLTELRRQQESLLCLDIDIERLDEQKQKAEGHFTHIAQKRFAARKTAAETLCLELTKHLRQLNIPHAEFFIDIKFDLSEDQVHFSLRANPGQPIGPIAEHASGGELARVMIALQSAIGDKHPTSTVVFDEIDANIGGETATIIGEIFSKLGKKKQVIAITHFPQVASQACHHLHIDKAFVDNETAAIIHTLDENERAKELLRMLGGRSFKTF